ncbi:hypothetical protein AJ79_08380 [Helicocarpus griseus UAMH5409]|uniref:DUF7905 domain-containing protein n=1 Tax=Helicocarpus griseus UAMH5409 TaxID=1447875 RepID=A0A2B7WTH2_9EURO|nr:hypothetical protein AJ79_08380 [Helicocarpus griseus UAMH5409]
MAEYELRAAREWREDADGEQARPRTSYPINFPALGNASQQLGEPSSGAVNGHKAPATTERGGLRGAPLGGRGVPVWVRGRGNGTFRGNYANGRGQDPKRYQNAEPAENRAKKNAEHFAKITRYTTAKEIRHDLSEKHQLFLHQLRQKPDPSIRFPETMLFLWPEDELPMEETLGKDLEVLDPIRSQFGYYIYLYDESPDQQNYIRVDGYDHEVIVEIVKRLRAKCAKLLTETGVKTKLYLVRVPPVDITKAEVALIKCRQADSRIIEAVPELFGGYLKPSELNIGLEKRKLLSSKNELRLRTAIDTALHGVRFLAGHVRMRVNFGKFVLENYKVPPDSKARHSFEEFRTMLFYPATKGRLTHGLEFKRTDGDLINRCSQASDILSPFDPLADSLEHNKPFYAVNIEFKGANNTLLRLEAEFSQSRHRSNLFEVSQRRWVKPQGNEGLGDKRPPLQIGVIDFEKSDWQMEIKALDFQEQSSIEQSLKSFAHSIEFKSGPTDGLRGTAVRRVSFSDFATVSKVTEKSALRYYLKDTRYIFELARYDTYHRMNHSGPPYISGSQISQTAETTWGASLFYAEWDNMLGKNGDFRAGETADWSADLNTFFPPFGDESSTDVNAGFRRFIDLVNQVAQLLTPEQKGVDVNGVERVDNPRPNIRPTVDVKPPQPKSWAQIAVSS